MRGPMTRWGAARFVITFLVLTALLLSSGRYAVNTRAMNWYLFQVARQTSFVLKLLGDASYVESPSVYEDRAAPMRLELDAWRRGEEPRQDDSVSPAAPLNAYEVWEHRALKLAHHLGTERNYRAMTDAIQRPAMHTPQERLAYIHASLDRLEASATRGTGPMAMHVAAKGVKETIESCGEIVKKLEGGAAPPTMSIDAAFDEIEAQIERGRVAQRNFLDERVRNITAQIQDRLGPQVTFVASEDPAKPLRFTFSLVPDCGALPSMSIYLAALIAFPASLRKRLLGIVIGVPILYGINVARLACLAMIGAWWRDDPGVFEFAHQYVWQAIYVLFVVGVWLLWVELIVRPGTSWRTNPTSAA